MKYNCVFDDGEPTSITVFIGSESLVANSDHPKFDEIHIGLAGKSLTADQLRGLFDFTVPLAGKFDRLSERVLVASGHVYFDGVEVTDALTDAIIRFIGSSDPTAAQPFVNFMEKIATNPSSHSREHLFRWLQKHNFALHPDGDLIAYKGVESSGKSQHSGTAIVNNQLVNGQIPNAPGTIIEMARDQVTFDPRNGCSTGLHVANWQFARSFASKTLRVKVNPRDVVSVPVDSGDQKMRVCRYRVLDVVTSEPTDLIYLGNADTRTTVVQPEKTAARAAEKKEAVKVTRRGEETVQPVETATQPTEALVPLKFPRHYENFTAEHFATMEPSQLKWLLGEWGVSMWAKPSKRDLVKRAVKVAAERLSQKAGKTGKAAAPKAEKKNGKKQ